MSDRAAAYERFKSNLDDLSCLSFAWRSHHGRPLGGPPVGRRDWAECLEWLARMARHSDALAQVARAIGMPPLYQTTGEVAAHVYREALTCMSRPYDDVIGRSGPEPGRPSQHVRDWTRQEKILVLAYLRRATHCLDACASGYGWALEQLAEEERVLLPSWPRRTS